MTPIIDYELIGHNCCRGAIIRNCCAIMLVINHKDYDSFISVRRNIEDLVDNLIYIQNQNIKASTQRTIYEREYDLESLYERL